MARSVTPGYVVVYPNREKATSRLTKLIVSLLLVLSAALMLLVCLGGWSKLQGMKPVELAWAAIDLILAVYVMFRWSRGALTLGAGLAILLLMVSVIAGAGLTGTSWFQRNSFGYGSAHSIFGADTLGTLTVLLAPVQVVLVAFAMLGFSQSWNVETEAPIEEARRRGYRVPPGSKPPAGPEPAAA
jgi:hypothetical protein